MNIVKIDYPDIVDHVPTEDVIRNGLLNNRNSNNLRQIKCKNHIFISLL